MFSRFWKKNKIWSNTFEKFVKIWLKCDMNYNLADQSSDIKIGIAEIINYFILTINRCGSFKTCHVQNPHVHFFIDSWSKHQNELVTNRNSQGGHFNNVFELW